MTSLNEIIIFEEEKIMDKVCQMAMMEIVGTNFNIEAATPYRNGKNISWMIEAFNLDTAESFSVPFEMVNPDSERYLVNKL